MLVVDATRNKVIEALKEYHPTVLQTNLNHDDQEALAKALQS